MIRTMSVGGEEGVRSVFTSYVDSGQENLYNADLAVRMRVRCAIRVGAPARVAATRRRESDGEATAI